MKTRFIFHWGFVATAFLLATAVLTTASIEDLTKAKVVRIKGSARFTTGTGTWQPLKVGDVLSSGTVIQTAADSRVDLVLGDPKAIASEARVGLPFASATPAGAGEEGGGASGVDQNFLRLMENTVLSVDQLLATDTGASIVTDTQLDLRAGRVFGTVKKLTAGSRYEIRIPNGVAGVRGTIYLLSANGDCSVWDGAMGLALDVEDMIRERSIGTKQSYDAESDTLSELSGAAWDELYQSYLASRQAREGSSAFSKDQVRNPEDVWVSPNEGFQGDDDSQGDNDNQ